MPKRRPSGETDGALQSGGSIAWLGHMADLLTPLSPAPLHWREG
jgi:hypothetical protein